MSDLNYPFHRKPGSVPSRSVEKRAATTAVGRFRLLAGRRFDNKGDLMIDRVCMFCGAVYGQKPGLGCDGPTHGICPSCEPHALALLEDGPSGESMPLSDLGREVDYVGC